MFRLTRKFLFVPFHSLKDIFREVLMQKGTDGSLENVKKIKIDNQLSSHFVSRELSSFGFI
jgi:hypothetical protein